MNIRASDHPIIMGNPNLFSESTSIFGHDEAELLIDALIASYDMGHEYLPAISSIERVTVDVQENSGNRPVQGRARLGDSTIKLGLNLGSSVEDIIKELPDVVIHETAHLVHVQRNPKFFIERREESRLHLGSAIMEGVAVHAGRKLGAFSIYSEGMFQQQKVLEALSQLLKEPDPAQHETYEQFMLGTEEFSNRGYRIGEYVVASIANDVSLTTQELMELSLDDFTDYAKTLV